MTRHQIELIERLINVRFTQASCPNDAPRQKALEREAEDIRAQLEDTP